MARREADREDLLAEATALVERAELQVPGEPEPVVLGVRKDGCLSVYFGGDLALHFNSQQQLRRAYLDGELIKAERGNLVGLHRRRDEEEVQLVRHERAATDQTQLLATWQARLTQLSLALSQEGVQALRAVPGELPAVARAREWLAKLPQPLSIAASPHAR